MRNFLSIVMGILVILNFFLFQKEEWKRKIRIAILIVLALVAIFSLLTFFVPSINEFSIRVEEAWTGSVLHNIAWTAVILSCLIGIFLSLKKSNYNIKTIILVGVATIILIQFILFISFDRTFSSAINEQMNDQNYYFERLDVYNLWKHSTGYSQTIAIIDSGITEDARELFVYNIKSTYNAFDGSQDVLDENIDAHGTQMASIIIGDGTAGVHGIAPCAELVIIKAFEGEYSRTSGEVLAAAVDHAIREQVDIISMSFGSFQVNDELEQAIERAFEADITVVAATGDYGNRDSLFPARMEGVISVRAKDYNGEIWVRSNIGENDIMSMYGVDIRALTHNNEYIYMSGTSQATALTAGYIALINDYQMHNDVLPTNEDIVEMLLYLDSNNQQEVDYLAPFRFNFR